MSGEAPSGPHATVVDVVVMALHLAPDQATRAVDVLSRTALGLALEGIDVRFNVDAAECSCDDEEVSP
jgi:hypothetical protein